MPYEFRSDRKSPPVQKSESESLFRTEFLAHIENNADQVCLAEMEDERKPAQKKVEKNDSDIAKLKRHVIQDRSGPCLDLMFTDSPKLFEVLDQVQHMPQVKQLRVGGVELRNRNGGFVGYALEERHLDKIGTAGQLESLWLMSTQATDAEFKQVCGLKNLSVLRIQDCPKLTGQTLERIGKMDKLRVLVYDGSVSKKGIESIASLSNLRVLKLPAQDLTAKDLEVICKLPEVRVLELNGLKTGVESINEMKNLRYLSLRNSSITGKEVAGLAANNQLVELDLTGTKFSENALQQLSEISSLRTVDLSKCALRNADLVVLSKLTALESLGLRNIPGITDEAIPFLSRLKGLKHLSIEGTGITQSGIARLREALPNLREP
jgi:Leucine-rich repeat (LRR) protein